MLIQQINFPYRAPLDFGESTLRSLPSTCPSRCLFVGSTGLCFSPEAATRAASGITGFGRPVRKRVCVASGSKVNGHIAPRNVSLSLMSLSDRTTADRVELNAQRFE
jgi:hypothetical protein